MEWNYILLICLLSLFVLCLIIIVVLNIVLINIFLVRKKPKNEKNNDALMEDLGGGWSEYFHIMDETKKLYSEITPNELELKYKDGKIRRGYFYENKNSDILIVFAHGWTSESFENLGFVGRFAINNGYNVLAVDAKGHGKSEGKLFGFAVSDYDALCEWCKYINSISDKKYHIFLHGVSMGGATVLYCSDKNIDGLDGIIDDCGFTSPWEEFYHGLLKYLKSKSLAKFILSTLNIIGRLCLKMNIKLNTKDCVMHSNVPILFIHGDKDDFVPTFMSIDNYNSAINNGHENELWITEGCRHGTSCFDKIDEYEMRIVKFINKNKKEVNI